jgi:hypothetical protein
MAPWLARLPWLYRELLASNRVWRNAGAGRGAFRPRSPKPVIQVSFRIGLLAELKRFYARIKAKEIFSPSPMQSARGVSRRALVCDGLTILRAK